MLFAGNTHIYLLISHVGPVHPVEHVHTNSLTGGADGVLAPPKMTLFASRIGRALTGFPIELMPRIPRITTALVVCSSDDGGFWACLRVSDVYFMGSCRNLVGKEVQIDDEQT